jgi:ribosome-binding protein aMBF1 (putative translation factor)
MTKPGNYGRAPWNRGTARMTADPSRLGPVMAVIVNARIHQQCSQEWLAEKTGWSKSAISRYELGTDRVPLAYAEAAVKALGIRVVIGGEL